MATSQNGWGVLTSAPDGKLEWITGRVRPGDVLTVFDYLCQRFNSEVEKITVGHSWGWANRPIRGSSSTSNHASGTAIDLNAPKHPLGKVGTFSRKQVDKIHAILRDLGGAIRWGGDYRNRKDEMHFEVNTSAAQLKKVADAIRRGEKPKPVGGGTSGSNTYTEVKGSTPLVKLYHKGEPVKRIQKAVGVGKVDGFYGPDTVAKVKAYQKAHGLSADGIVGPDTWAKINAGAKPPKAPSAPAFPWPSDHYIGPKSGPARSHSGVTGNDSTHVRTAQQQLLKRGWNGVGKADGLYGPKLAKVVRQFQAEKGLPVDGLIGPATWKALWTEPVT